MTNFDMVEKYTRFTAFAMMTAQVTEIANMHQHLHLFLSVFTHLGATVQKGHVTKGFRPLSEAGEQAIKTAEAQIEETISAKDPTASMAVITLRILEANLVACIARYKQELAATEAVSELINKEPEE